MQEAAIAPVGASLLASFSTRPRRARETSSLLQGLCSANMRQIPALTVQTGKHHMQVAAIASVGASLSRELFKQQRACSRAFQPNHEELARQGLCSANMRQIAALTVQTGKHPIQEAAIAPVGASLLASFSTKPRRARFYRVRR
ncbi:hypothetical protein B195_003255 [Pseudomonas sp. Lz4W]|nr:hypothetical protein B195_003255 [Pseudomonas sp. Lz4W]